MIRILIACFIALSLGVNAYADMKDLTLKEISERTSAFASNLIPGEGDTEISIDFRENASPDLALPKAWMKYFKIN